MDGVIFLVLSPRFDEYVHALRQRLFLPLLMYVFDHRLNQNVNEVRFLHGLLTYLVHLLIVLLTVHRLHGRMEIVLQSPR